MGSRTWFKIYADKWLDGSIRQDTPEIRAIFIDLLALAASGRWGDDGIIQVAPKTGFSAKQLAKISSISCTKMTRILNFLVKTNRISIDKTGVIIINNWKKYQSEYERQTHYRESTKLQPKVTTKSTTQSNPRERDREGERE